MKLTLVLLGYLSVCLLTPITQNPTCSPGNILSIYARGSEKTWDVSFRWRGGSHWAQWTVGPSMPASWTVFSLLRSSSHPTGFPFLPMGWKRPWSQIPIVLRALPTSKVSTHGCHQLHFLVQLFGRMEVSFGRGWGWMENAFSQPSGDLLSPPDRMNLEEQFRKDWCFMIWPGWIMHAYCFPSSFW